MHEAEIYLMRPSTLWKIVRDGNRFTGAKHSAVGNAPEWKRCSDDSEVRRRHYRDTTMVRVLFHMGKIEMGFGAHKRRATSNGVGRLAN